MTGVIPLLAPEVETRKFRITCRCGTFYRNVRLIAETVRLLRRCGVPPGAPFLTFRCERCKHTVFVTAREVGVSA